MSSFTNPALVRSYAEAAEPAYLPPEPARSRPVIQLNSSSWSQLFWSKITSLWNRITDRITACFRFSPINWSFGGSRKINIVKSDPLITNYFNRLKGQKKAETKINKLGIGVFITKELDSIADEIHPEIDKAQFYITLPLYEVAHLQKRDLQIAAHHLISDVNNQHRRFSDKLASLKKTIRHYLTSLSEKDCNKSVKQLLPLKDNPTIADLNAAFERAVLEWISKKQKSFQPEKYDALQDAKGFQIVENKEIVFLIHKLWGEFSQNPDKELIFEIALGSVNADTYNSEDEFRNSLLFVDKCLASPLRKAFIKDFRERLVVEKEWDSYRVQMNEHNMNSKVAKPIKPTKNTTSAKQFCDKYKDLLNPKPVSEAEAELVAAHIEKEPLSPVKLLAPPATHSIMHLEE